MMDNADKIVDMSLTLEASTLMPDLGDSVKPDKCLGELVRDNDQLRRHNDNLELQNTQLKRALLQFEQHTQSNTKGDLVVDLTNRCYESDAKNAELAEQLKETQDKMGWKIESLMTSNDELKNEIKFVTSKHQIAENEAAKLGRQLASMTMRLDGNATISDSEQCRLLEKDFALQKENYESMLASAEAEMKETKNQLLVASKILEKVLVKYNILTPEGIKNFGVSKLGIENWFSDDDFIISAGGMRSSIKSNTSGKQSLDLASTQNETLETAVAPLPPISLNETNFLCRTMNNASLAVDMNMTQSGVNNLQTSLFLMKELMERMFRQLQSAALVLSDAAEISGIDGIKDLMLQIKMSINDTMNDASAILTSVNDTQGHLMDMTKALNQTVAEEVAVGETISEERYLVLVAEAERLKEQTEFLSTQLQDTVNRLSTGNRKVFEASVEVRRLEGENEKLIADLSGLMEEQNKMLEENKDLLEKVKYAEESNLESCEMLKKLSEEIEGMSAELDSKTMELSTASEENSTLKSDFSNLEAEYLALEDKLKEVSTAFNEASEKLQQIDIGKENIVASAESALLSISLSNNSLFDSSRASFTEPNNPLKILKDSVDKAGIYCTKIQRYCEEKRDAESTNLEVKRVLGNLLSTLLKMSNNIKNSASAYSDVRAFILELTASIDAGNNGKLPEEAREKLKNELKNIVQTLKEVHERSGKLLGSNKQN
uniref:Chromosome segregation protein SMC n=1 Tax=Rhabditophanes sp. KR3021 TaxID=114890 RepID=A0AC35UHX0_9BILA